MAVSDKVQICTVNDAANFTLTSDVSADTDYPLTNMQLEDTNKPCVIPLTAETEVNISWTGATGYDLNFIILSGINFPDDNTVRLRLYPNAGKTGTAYDGTALAVVSRNNNMRDQWILFFNTFNAKSGEIKIATPSYRNAKLEIDKLFMGESYVFTYGHEHESRFMIEDKSEHMEKPAGGFETYVGNARRRADLIFAGVTDSELVAVSNMLEIAHKGKDIMMSADPDDTRGLRHKRSGVFRRHSDQDFTSRYFNGHEFGISLVEN